MKKIYKGRISEIAAVSKDIAAFCAENGAEGEDIFAFTLCLEEIFSNIVKYGYAGESGDVEVELKTDGGEMRAVVGDSARPFNPLAHEGVADVRAGLDSREIGGMGLLLVKKHMDEISYRRESGRNVLSLSKKLQCLA